MRTCIYQEGEIIQVEGDCVDPFYAGNPLVDWSDSIVTTDLYDNQRKLMVALGIVAIAFLFMGGRR